MQSSPARRSRYFSIPGGLPVLAHTSPSVCVPANIRNLANARNLAIAYSQGGIPFTVRNIVFANSPNARDPASSSLSISEPVCVFPVFSGVHETAYVLLSNSPVRQLVCSEEIEDFYI